MTRFSLYLHRAVYRPLKLFSDNTLISADATENTIYLTFDDGPHPVHTPTLLRLLDKFNISATFFVTGIHALKYQSLLEEISNQRHTIGNHGWQHLNLNFKTGQTIRYEIMRCHDIVAELAGFRYIFRPPFGAWNPWLVNICRQLRYTVVFWSYSAADYNTSYWINNDLAGEMIARVRPGNILLLHDGLARADITVEALRKAIPYWLQAGYKLAALSDIKSIRGIHE